MRPPARASLAALFIVATALVLLPFREADAALFRRGDSNGDARIDVSDAVGTLLHLFAGGGTPGCRDAADTNDDGRLDISDALYALRYLFSGGPALPAPGIACGEDPTPDDLDCEAQAACSIDRGQSAFASPLTGGVGVYLGGDRDNEAAGGVPPSPAEAPAAPTPAADTAREIEESDIYKIVGDHIFILNRYRGLQILDLSDLDAPRLVGQAPIYGYPREMYVRDDTAYVIVSDYYTFWRDTSSIEPSMAAFFGSQLRILDISDVTQPTVIGGIDLAGDCSDSRIVGDVMYLVSHRYPWWGGYATDDTEDRTEVLSVQVADPGDVRKIDSVEFPRNGWEHHIHATPDAIYLAASGWVEEGGSWGSETRVRAIDIGDPLGTIIVRGEAVVRGRILDRWCLDAYEGVLRVASSDGWGNGDVYLTTISVQDPDHPARLGSYVLHVDESLTAARFDGPRGYLVSYRNIDPLFTFDLSQPAQPRLLGELEMTGWLDFIVPLGGGERLVALGHEDLTTPDGGREISLAVSLIDVSKQTAPTLLSRVSLDGVWGWVPSSRDDFAKVFKVLQEQGLILFPFQAWSQVDWKYVGGVQLIDLAGDALLLRGLIQDAGWVERGIPYDPTTVLTLSSEVFQVMDTSDRDVPRLRSRVELSRNVLEFALLPGTEAVQLCGDWYSGDAQLVVTPADDPNAVEATSRFHLPAPYGRMFTNGSLAYVVSVREESDPDGSNSRSVTWVDVIDLSDPASPRKRGSVPLPESVWPGYRSWYWGSGDEAVQVNGTTLAFHRFQYPWIYWDCLACDAVPMGGPALEGADAHEIYLVDLADPDLPVVASTVKIENVSWAWGLRASGSILYLSFYESFLEADQWMARYFLSRVDVGDPAQPVVLPDVNIPGIFIDASETGPYLYTLESWWDNESQKSRNLFHVLALEDDKAYLQSSVELPGYVYGVEVEGDSAVAASQYWETVFVDETRQSYVGRVDLLTLDLRDPGAASLAGTARVPFDYAYLQKVEGGRAFLGSGAGLFVYDVSDVTAPTYQAFFRTQGWTQDIVLGGDRAWVPSGYHGVQILELGSPAP